MSKKTRDKTKSEKHYSNTVKKTGKWRGKKAGEYVKYKKQKKEKKKDWKFTFRGFTSLDGLGRIKYEIEKHGGFFRFIKIKYKKR